MKRVVLSLIVLLSCLNVAVAQDPGFQNEALKSNANTAGSSTKLATDKKGRLLNSYDPNTGIMAANLPVSSGTLLGGTGAGVVAWTSIGGQTVTTGSTASVIQITSIGSTAFVGDAVMMQPNTTTAGLRRQWATVTAVATNSITVSPAFTAAPASGDTLALVRAVPIFAAATSGQNGNALHVAIDYNYQQATSGGILKQEDVAYGDGEAGVSTFAKAQTALTSDQTANDHGAFKTDMVGRTMVGFAPPGELVLGCNSAVTTATTGTMLAADASNRFYVSQWNCTNTGGTASRVILEDSDGTDLANVFLAATTGQSNVPFPVPVPANAINKALQVNVITAGSSTICCFNGYKSAV